MSVDPKNRLIAQALMGSSLIPKVPTGVPTPRSSIIPQQVAAMPNTLYNLNPAYFDARDGQNPNLHMTPEQLIDMAQQVEGAGDWVTGGLLRGHAAILLDPAKSMKVRKAK